MKSPHEVARQTAARERQRQGRKALTGTCDVNALQLARELESEGHTAEVVWGWLDVEEATSPETVHEAYRQAVVHVWVELRDDPRDAVVELASSVPEQYGEPVFLPRRPDSYRVLERYPYHEGMIPGETLLDTYESVID